MNKKDDIAFIIISIIITVLSLIYLSQASYAKYRRQATGNVTASIASWNIVINNETINNKTSLTSSITPTFDANPYVKEDSLAPGSTGYFDITINAEEVDVDFTYTITCAVNENTPLEDITFTSYEINGTSHNFVTAGVVTGNLLKNSSDTEIRIHFKWNDDATNTMSNQDDTEYAIDEDNANTQIDVTIHFTQKQ